MHVAPEVPQAMFAPVVTHAVPAKLQQPEAALHFVASQVQALPAPLPVQFSPCPDPHCATEPHMHTPEVQAFARAPVAQSRQMPPFTPLFPHAVRVDEPATHADKSLLQHPPPACAPQLAVSQVHVKVLAAPLPVHFIPAPQMLPVLPHWHAPEAHRLALLPTVQSTQMSLGVEPTLPQAVAVTAPVTQLLPTPVPVQQPPPDCAPHAVTSHTQLAAAPLPEHFKPAPHAAPVAPQTHAPPTHTFALVTPPALVGQDSPLPLPH